MSFKYSEKQLAFLKEFYPKYRLDLLTECFNKKFGLEKTKAQISSTLKNHQIKSGRTGRFSPGHKPHNTGTKGIMKANSGSFKTGRVPYNHCPVGEERVTTDGYLKVKVAEPDRWQFKHIMVWERVCGCLPNTLILRFKDGNKLNCDIENLMAIDRQLHFQLNKLNYNPAPDAVKPTLINLGKLKCKLFEVEKNKEANRWTR